MKDETQKIYVDPSQAPAPKRKRRFWHVFLCIVAALVVLFGLLYLAWLRPSMLKPLAEQLNLSALTGQEPQVTSEVQDGVVVQTTAQPVQPPSNLQALPPAMPVPTLKFLQKPACGKQASWTVLLVGIDYSGDYLYGLADVIRIAQVDWVNLKVNMVALPRDLLVEAPSGRFTEENPMKINQAYLFGTKGWGGYLGEGNGANSLAEVIQYNFGVTANHYAVVDFGVVVDFINAIGGVEVNLPQGVTDPSPDFGSFPAGKQTLSGERALALMRIRTNYSDAFRVSNQTIVMRAILNKLIQPATLVKVPSLITKFKDAFLTDLSLDQITSIGLCFLRKFDGANLRASQVPNELITADYVYLPSLDSTAYVYRWDSRLVDWIQQTLLQQ